MSAEAQAKGAEAARRAKHAMVAARLALLKPAIEDIQTAGHTSLIAIAQELSAHEIGAPRGGTWSATQVSRVLQRIAP